MLAHCNSLFVFIPEYQTLSVVLELIALQPVSEQSSKSVVNIDDKTTVSDESK